MPQQGKFPTNWMEGDLSKETKLTLLVHHDCAKPEKAKQKKK